MTPGGWEQYAVVCHTGLRVLWEVGPQHPPEWARLVDEMIGNTAGGGVPELQRVRRIEVNLSRLEPLRTIGLVEDWDDGTVHVRQEGVGGLANYPEGFPRPFVELMVRAASSPPR